jgi:hypothetical protein
MNKIEYALRLAKDCTYADEMTEGAKEFLRKTIDEALTEVLPQADVSNRRELLINFITWAGFDTGEPADDLADEFIQKKLS